MTAGAAVLAWTIALSVVDIRDHRLPNRLTLPGAAVILAAAALCGRGFPASAGGAVLGGLYLVVHCLNPSGMGAGDVKLALGLGALAGALGAAVWVPAALAAPVLTAAAGRVSAARGRGRAVPHGPSMCAATLVAAALAL